MAHGITYGEFSCPKCERPIKIAHEADGALTKPTTVGMICPWDGCGHTWPLTLPGKPLTSGPAEGC